MSQLLRCKSIDSLIRESEESNHKLSKTLGLWSLVAMGIGAVIGSGIFTLTGTAAAGVTMKYQSVLHAPVLDLLRYGPDAISTIGRPGAGPAVVISFLLVAFACGFAALCYAELASMIPIAGSTYTYAYATLGEVFAWIIGWDLILEYAVSNMSVAVGFSGYFNDILDNLLGVRLPPEWSGPAFRGGEITGAYFNLPALLIMILLTWLLIRGVRESANATSLMVVIKVLAILAFVLGAANAIDPAHWVPFSPNGTTGIISGAAIVFFAYIGFDSVSTAAEECKNPKRDMPWGIIITLLVCALLYGAVALVLTGIVPYTTLGTTDEPVAKALKDIGYNRLRVFVSLGALIGMWSSLLVFQYGQARIWFAMSRDKLLPGLFSKVHPKFRTPHVSTWIAGFVVGIPAGIWDIATFAELANIGTLAAFASVSAGVIILRRRQPDRARGFRVPLVPWVPGFSILFCLVLMLGLPLQTWIAFFIWLIIGLAIYFAYSKSRSSLAQEI
ncbi:amino acid permease [Bryobacter aggregatus]|uniref:amino acid permease n=1 Tax=Bryobacter aggregatus TaxID=360054 RepID=UPI0004E23928|nr:amino acid permease [Bryobacter aggregatus]